MGNDKSKPEVARPAPVSMPKVSEAVEGAQQMGGAIDRLTKRVDFLEKQMEAELTKAKVSKKAGNTKAALIHLKKKKMLEKDLGRTRGYVIQLETQRMSIESAQIQSSVVESMTAGAAVQKRLNAKMDVDKVDDLMANIQESMDDSNAVADLLSTPMGDNADESELDEMFDLLGEEEEEEEEVNVASQLDALPEVPTGAPVALPAVPVHTPDDDDGLLELERMMQLEAE